MKTVRLLLLCVSLPSVVLSTACTQPVRRCGPTTCAGCCDNNGECQSGVSIVSCGINGDLCSTCGTGQTCTNGACGTGSMGGGAAGGSSGGGTGGGDSVDGGADAGTGVACASGFTACGTSCTITSADSANCGRCGNACGSAAFCEQGQCVPLPASCVATNPTACPPNFFCDSSGACRQGCRSNGNCTGGQTCNLSMSRCECPVGQNFCGACLPADTITACGAQCLNCAAVANATPSCSNGACDFTCNPGFHRCGNQCVSNSSPLTCGTRCEACPPAPNSTPTCDGTSCGLACAAGFHLCGTECVSDFSELTCGTSCTPCQAPANAMATCAPQGAGLPPACSFDCAPGFAKCGTMCVAESVTQCGPTCQRCTTPTNGSNPQCVGGACQYSCATGFHQCGTQCVSDTAVASCGTSCTPCATVTNGMATCTGGQCGIQCNPNFHECNGQCVSNLDPATCGARCSPCPDGPMGSNTTTTCDGLSCGLRCMTPATPNYCNGVCVADSVMACGTSCQVCATPANGTAACTAGRCDVVCNQGFHRCGTQCVADDAVDTCGSSCMPCPDGPVNSVRTCTRPNVAAPFACGWACGAGSNRCPTNGSQCVPADFTLGCGPTCAICSSSTANQRGVCNTNGICGTGCITTCGGACVNVLNDGAHCGACNQACQASERCSIGECRDVCVSGVSFRTMLPAITGSFSSNGPMLVVDVNGDGRGDLVTGESTIIAVRYGQPSGFAPTASTTVSAGFSVGSIVAGDLTGDGRPELVAISAVSTTAAVLRNSGTGTFTTFTFTSNPLASLIPTSVTIGEFTGAAPQDVLLGFNTSSNLQSAILFPGVAGAPNSPLGTGASAGLGIGLVSNVRAVNVNGDANSDLVVTASTNAIFVFPGTGVQATPFDSASATLAQLPPGDSFVISGLVPLVVTDVTGDAVPDVTVSSLAGGTFQARVFPLTTTFTIGTSIALPTTAAVRVISVADVDGDGRADVGVGANDLRVFLGLPGSAFSAAQLVGVRVNGQNPQSLVLVDITQDGRADLVAQNSSSTIVTVPNDNGGFPSLQGASVPQAERIVAGDLTGDGLIDVVALPSAGAIMTAQVLYGTDGGAFVNGPQLAVRSDRAAIGRLNNDAFDDLVTIGPSLDASVPDAGGTTVGLPAYRLADTTMPTSTTIRGRLEVERNGIWGSVCDDGWGTPDSEVACRSLGYPSSGAFSFGNQAGPTALPINMDDVACVGTESELLLCAFTSSHNCSHVEDVGLECSLIGAAPVVPTVAQVHFGSATGPTTPVTLSTPTSPTLVALGDLDSDGTSDVIVSTATTLHWFRNLGAGTFGPAQLIPTTGASAITVVDLNNDGRRDLVVASPTASSLVPLINIGGGFIAGTSLSVFGTAGSSIAAGDLNNDSKLDVVFSNRTFRGDGAGGLAAGQTFTTLPPRFVLSDFDNDGQPDLAAGGSSSSGVVVLRGDAVQLSSFATVAATFSAGAPVADLSVAALNADDQRDLVVLQGDLGSRFVSLVPGVCR